MSPDQVLSMPPSRPLTLSPLYTMAAVNIRMFKPIEKLCDLLSLFEPNRIHLEASSQQTENDSVQFPRMIVCSFIHSELKKECKKITWRWEKTRWGLGYRVDNKIMYSLEGGYASEGSENEAFQRYVNPDAQITFH